MEARHAEALRAHVAAVLSRTGFSAATEAEVMREMVGHLEDAVTRAVALGTPVDDAVTCAIRDFGSPETNRARLRAGRLRADCRAALRLPPAVTVLLGTDVLSLIVWINIGLPPSWDAGVRRQALTVMVAVACVLVYWGSAALLRFAASTLLSWWAHRSDVVEALLAVSLIGIGGTGWVIVRPGLFPVLALETVAFQPGWRSAVDSVAVASIVVGVLAGLLLARSYRR